MKLCDRLSEIWKDDNTPFLISEGKKISFSKIKTTRSAFFNKIKKGNVVALIGDYDLETISFFITLIDLKAIILPLTSSTKNQHESFFNIAQVDFIIEQGNLKKRKHRNSNKILDRLRNKNQGGIISFSSGTSGEPKAILHDTNLFLKKFLTPRKPYITLNFLLFDHIGGLNTMFHTLFNKGTIVIPRDRSIQQIMKCCEKFDVELLPTTPSFLRMLMLSDFEAKNIPKSISVISYGTEAMDQFTLKKLCLLFPNIDFRQTYGISELGVFRVKSIARDSLYIRIEGDGIKIRVTDNILEIKTKYPMVGYLNSPSPFTKDGWYKTGDIVKEKKGCYRIIGRDNDIINVSGLKFMALDVETVAMKYPDIIFAKSYSKSNPISGQHCEIAIQVKQNSNFNKQEFQYFLNKNLLSHMVPKKIILTDITLSHRFKKIMSPDTSFQINNS